MEALSRPMTSTDTMKKLLPITLIATLSCLASSAMACYTVYDSKNELVYDKFEAPVNMRLPLHNTVPARVPGGHMVFSTQSTNCSGTDQLSSKPAEQVTPTAAATEVKKSPTKKRRVRYNR